MNALAIITICDHLTASDLEREATRLAREGVEVRRYRAGDVDEERVQILYIPRTNRAGVAWGADARWTDATGPRDALERFLGAHGKQMID